jgi:hypothetical protein
VLVSVVEVPLSTTIVQAPVVVSAAKMVWMLLLQYRHPAPSELQPTSWIMEQRLSEVQCACASVMLPDHA